MKPVFFELQRYDTQSMSMYNISTEILMENVAYGMSCFIKKLIKKCKKNRRPKSLASRISVCIVCGSGNNGGDGFALARMLCDYADVKVFALGTKLSPLCKLQLDRLNLLKVPVTHIETSSCENLPNDYFSCDILVDAFLGTGLHNTLKDYAQNIISALNATEAIKVSCDVPSGLDAYGNPSPIAFVADYTLTAGALKEMLFSDNAKDYVGCVKLVKLGIPSPAYSPTNEANVFLLTNKDLHLPKRRLKKCHKGMFGHVAVFVGEKEGAAVLAAMAALKSGAGLVSVCGEKPMNLPSDIMYAKNIFSASSYCIGPGLTSNAEEIVSEFICNYKHDTELQVSLQTSSISDNTSAHKSGSPVGAMCDSPVVFDADALKTLSLAKNLSKLSRIVITPHPLEFCVLIQNLYSKNQLDSEMKHVITMPLTTKALQERPFLIAHTFSKQFPKLVLVLKGANPIIAHNGKLYVCTSGTNALAKAGSGDVLAGIIVSLLAQGYSPLDAACSGTLMHARASHCKKTYSSTATELIKRI